MKCFNCRKGRIRVVLGVTNLSFCHHEECLICDNCFQFFIVPLCHNLDDVNFMENFFCGAFAARSLDFVTNIRKNLKRSSLRFPYLEDYLKEV